MDRPVRIRGDRGESLIEVLVAVVILGIAGVAVLAGMGLSIKASDIHRKQTTGGAQIRAYAESIQQYVTANPSAYVNCPTATTYSSETVNFTKPQGFNNPSYTVKSVGPNVSGQIAPLTCANDVGLQMLTLSLASTDNRATEKLTFVLRRPCDTSVVTTCP